MPDPFRSLPSAEDLVSGARFLLGLRGFLRSPVTLEEARATLADRLHHRERDFLDLARRAIYGYPHSPYRALLRVVGCEYADLENLVCSEGVEGALQRLLRQGIYLTTEEARGRVPAVRGSRTVQIVPGRLLNPLLGRTLMVARGGSTSPGRVAPFDLSYMRARSITYRLLLHARGAEGWSHAVWGVPGSSALNHLMDYASAGAPPVRWFSPVDPDPSGLHPRYLWSGRLLHWASLVAGVPLPALELVKMEDLTPIIHWIREVLRNGGTPHIPTYVSLAVRLCETAASMGEDLVGAELTVSGEPATPERMSAIHASGARAVTSYGATETGGIGKGCLAPEVSDDLHLMSDSLAAIQPGVEGRQRSLPADALLLSSLRPTAKTILLNTSLGDTAVISARSCGCPMEHVGWTTHLHTVRSFEKLTTGGMAFRDVDVIRALEEALPGRFGGGPTDYQLVEQDTAGGRAQIRLLVHPRLGPVDEEAIAEAFLEAIGQGNGAARVMGLMWRQSNFVTVEREPPKLTPGGKILHLHGDAG